MTKTLVGTPDPEPPQRPQQWWATTVNTGSGVCTLTLSNFSGTITYTNIAGDDE